MNLTKKPELVQWPAMHYVFVEKAGPFQNTARECWGELHARVPELSKSAKILGMMALYQIEPEMIYRAGAKVDQQPERLPKGLQYIRFEGGKYSKFTLTGPYDLLPEACGAVFEMAEEQGIALRDAFYIEHYVNNPETAKPEDLITEILLPTE